MSPLRSAILGRMSEKPKRRWFSFSLRTMFVLLTAICVWVGYEVNWIRQRQDRLESLHVADHVDSVSIRAPGFLWLFGEEGHQHLVVADNQMTRDELKVLRSLFPEAHISVVNDWVIYYPSS